MVRPLGVCANRGESSLWEAHADWSRQRRVIRRCPGPRADSWADPGGRDKSDLISAEDDYFARVQSSSRPVEYNLRHPTAAPRPRPMRIPPAATSNLVPDALCFSRLERLDTMSPSTAVSATYGVQI